MEYIDKIYGSQGQWDELQNFLKKNRPQALKHMDRRPRGTKGHAPLANFPTATDMYLMTHCPLDFVQARLKEQYPNALNEKGEFFRIPQI